MSAVLSLTETQTVKALGDFLVAVLPAGVAVVIGQENLVPAPGVPDYVVMTPTHRERLATNLTTYGDAFDSGTASSRSDMQATKVTMQLDVHGPAAADNVQIIATLFRSSWGCDQFATSGFDVTPLYTGEAHQMPFVNESNQVEKRYSIDAVLQCNPVVTVPQDFASTLAVAIVSVDAVYPPT